MRYNKSIFLDDAYETIPPWALPKLMRVLPNYHESLLMTRLLVHASRMNYDLLSPLNIFLITTIEQKKLKRKKKKVVNRNIYNCKSLLYLS